MYADRRSHHRRSDPELFAVCSDEMNRNLMRTSYNTIVYEVRDFGLGLYDRHCRLLAEAPGLAIFTRANDYALGKTVEFLGEDHIHEGDVILLNYPFWSWTHTLDVTASSPIFYEDQLHPTVSLPHDDGEPRAKRRRQL